MTTYTSYAEYTAAIKAGERNIQYVNPSAKTARSRVDELQSRRDFAYRLSDDGSASYQH